MAPHDGTMSPAEFAAALRQAMAGVVVPDPGIPRPVREALEEVADAAGDDEDQAIAVRAARTRYRTLHGIERVAAEREAERAALERAAAQAAELDDEDEDGDDPPTAG